jgi:hypothetical protein
MRLETGEFIMTTKVRTLLSVAVIAGACSIATTAQGAEDICAGVPAKERAMGLLAFRDNIVSVVPLNEFRFAGKAKYGHTAGVVISLRATPEISVPWLERVNSCHIAMAGAGRLAGYDSALDPFILPGTTVGVAEVYAGYVLSVRGVKDDAIQAVLERSYALVSTPGAMKTASLEAR